VGIEELAAFAADLYRDLPARPGGRTPDPCAVLSATEPMTIRNADGRYLMSLALPLADKRQMDLRRKGDELVLTVAGHRRQLALPGVLARREITGADLVGDRLDISFAREPR
jgi:arsenite-transporting ATPase